VKRWSQTEEELEERHMNEEIAQVGRFPLTAIPKSKILADAMKKVGNEGVITVEEAKSLEPNSSRQHAIRSVIFLLSPNATRYA